MRLRSLVRLLNTICIQKRGENCFPVFVVRRKQNRQHRVLPDVNVWASTDKHHHDEKSRPNTWLLGAKLLGNVVLRDSRWIGVVDLSVARLMAWRGRFAVAVDGDVRRRCRAGIDFKPVANSSDMSPTVGARVLTNAGGRVARLGQLRTGSMVEQRISGLAVDKLKMTGGEVSICTLLLSLVIPDALKYCSESLHGSTKPPPPGLGSGKTPGQLGTLHASSNQQAPTRSDWDI
jgi:hypothetical protein